MGYYPIILDITDKNCLVVGGGAVATRKAKSLLEGEANVTIVSLEFTAELKLMAEKGELKIIKKGYDSLDIDKMFLVIGATDNEALNLKIYEDAKARNLLCNIVDFPKGCNFILPSVIKRGDLMVSISTSGKSPAFARYLREKFENNFGIEYEIFLKLMGSIRTKLLLQAKSPEIHKNTFLKLIESDILENIKLNKINKINEILRQILGEGYIFEELIQIS
ncbi:MAG: bifunctional precorrin-2 dehydrogenase/sirohydrochlorin ferrochelatase [Desulfobacterales bacterium]|nr:bifunctional precorrin-2 dehydrogenase/sirohydrochlorin ferrochelatase [Desulfobacterales bacterium]